MATTVYGLVAELDGLKMAVQGAANPTPSVIARPVSVFHRGFDLPYQGPFPYIMVTPVDYDFYRLSNTRKGQSGERPNMYSVAIWDQVSKTGGGAAIGGTNLVSASQTDIFLLIDALVAYWLIIANRCLPNKAATVSGGRVRFRFDPLGMYRNTEAGLVLGAMGIVTVVGVPMNET